MLITAAVALAAPATRVAVVELTDAAALVAVVGAAAPSTPLSNKRFELQEKGDMGHDNINRKRS